MSFILDALKKSENDRQRQSGPALFEVRVAPPRTRFTMWAIAVAVLLVINLAVIGWMTLHRSASPMTAAASPSLTPAPVGLPSGPTTAPAPASPAAVTSTPAASVSAAPGSVANVTPATPGVGTPTLTPSNGPPGNGPDLSNNPRPEGQVNPDDYEPAKDPGTQSAGQGHVTRSTESGLQSYEEMVANPATHVPELRLDLHVYAANPKERFVFINMRRLREGDSLPDGVRVDSITAEGAIMSFRGSRFVLQRQ
jgi:general secretion pathway protein B